MLGLPGAVEMSYDVIVDGATTLVSVVTKFDVIVVLWYTVEAGALKLLVKVVVLAGTVTNLVEVSVLGARVWIVVEM